MQHRTIRGRILYTSKKPEMMDKERGREEFAFSRHGDGKLTLRAHCEIEEPTPTVMREIVYSLDENDKPMDCLVRLTVGDAFVGAGFFRCGPDFIECESYGPSIGRISQRLAVEPGYDGFGTHPIVGDGYMTKCMDLSKGPHKRQVRAYLPSPDHRGATPPMIAEAQLFLEYVGEETVTVKAGTFQARHYIFTDEDNSMAGKDGAHPQYDMWVTADEDAIFLKGGVGGYMQTWYELVELER